LRFHRWSLTFPLADMNARLRIFGIVAGVSMLAVILVVFAARPKPARLINGERLANAMARYTKDLHSRGEALPPTITLDTLVAKGYLNTEDTKPMQGIDLIFHTDAVDTSPQMFLVEAHMPDGQIQVVLADGSVQQYSRSRWAEAQRNVGQQVEAPNERH
jgi:hypothetical protein